MMATARKSTNWFAIGVTAAAVVVVLVIAGVVWFANNQATSPGTVPESSAVNADTGAISVGSGNQTVDTYVDFMCPVCNSFEQAYGPTLQQLADGGTITLNIHPIAILDAQSQGTQYSTRAAGAAYCVAVDDAANVPAFVKALYAQQPKEGTSGLDDATLATIAKDAGASDAVTSCIQDGTYTKFVTAMTKKTPSQTGSGISTPTIAINGQVLVNQKDLTGDPQKDIVGRLNG
ncbi:MULTISPECIES: thioredoxin domain-containing protein [unclassified Microbacterium]|jgi:protein-disulfide isomerase|uniref:DsbA family protein n=1 Tax=unclassified Microbacterium TaxID=2609290 RepID=UPI001D69CAB3|nr:MULTISPECIES: thioredoxin domain-containing protein [unclassified Microbacterium]CAH0128872.1 Serine/threonine-protein kinase PknE [Microbacterium sp. Bi128]